jgi:hypothetical protein
LTKRSFPSLLGHIPSCSALSTTIPWSRTPSTPLDASGSPKWPPRLFLRRGAFVSSTRSFLTLLGCSWTSLVPFGTAVPPPSSIGSSPGLLSEFSRPFHSEHLLTCSDVFRSFFYTLLAPSTCLDTADVSVSPPGSLVLRVDSICVLDSLRSSRCFVSLRGRSVDAFPCVSSSSTSACTSCGASSAYGLSPWVDFDDCVVCRLVACVTVSSTRTLHLVKQFVGLLESCSTSEPLYSSLL